MFTVLLELAEAALSIWQSKEKRKYIDKIESLKKDFYAEKSKPRAEQSDAVLDNISFELRLVSRSLSADMRTPE